MTGIDYEDLWYQGYACGLDGLCWLSAVGERFLRPWQRAELAAGWRAGLEGRAEWERANVEAAAQRAWEAEANDAAAAERMAVPQDDEPIPF